MRICSLSVPRLKHEWNQTVWSVNNLRCGTAGPDAMVPQPELRNQLGRSKLSKLGEIDEVYQLRGAVGGANPPLRLVPGSGGETPLAMWGEPVSYTHLTLPTTPYV